MDHDLVEEMRQYIVDAFTGELFKGNPAAACILDEWISDELMQNIAVENNLSETAFAVKTDDYYHIRWFTPGGEVDLCGHASLATAYVILNFYEDTPKVHFKTNDDVDLIITRKGELYEMEFPAYDLEKVEITGDIIDALGVMPKEVYRSRDLLCVLESADDVVGFKPDLDKLEKLDGLLVHITAKGESHDCVSRSFAPRLNIAEDPVCGSGHCHIAPYWSGRLNKNEIIAYQASKRSGILYCRVVDDKVFLAGKAVLFSTCELEL